MSKLLGTHYPFTRVTRRYFRPTDEPQIHMEWLKMNIPWEAEPDDTAPDGSSSISLIVAYLATIGRC